MARVVQKKVQIGTGKRAGDPARATAARLKAWKKEVYKEFIRRLELKTPVDTGNLQASWKRDSTPPEGRDFFVIKSEVDYAQWVEYGSTKMQPRRMVRRTLAEIDDIKLHAARKVGLK